MRRIITEEVWAVFGPMVEGCRLAVDARHIARQGQWHRLSPAKGWAITTVEVILAQNPVKPYCRCPYATRGLSMGGSRPSVLLSWSSGKDSVWALHLLRRSGDVEVVGLLTTFNEAADRVAMHAVRRELVEDQAAAAGLPLYPVMLPHPCTNEVYEARMKSAIAQAKGRGVTHMAFGDLYLEDIRAYRVRLLEGTGIGPLFPIWSSVEETPALARRMLGGGLRAVVTCVDPRRVSEAFLGREYDEKFLADLPAGVDPCGERGEFHTFCYACPRFRSVIRVVVGESVHRDGFWFADLRRLRHPG